jgi:hypothetical protein
VQTGAAHEPTCEERIHSLEGELAAIRSNLATMEDLIYDSKQTAEVGALHVMTLEETTAQLRLAQNENAGKAQTAVKQVHEQLQTVNLTTVGGFITMLLAIVANTMKTRRARLAAEEITGAHREAELAKLDQVIHNRHAGDPKAGVERRGPSPAPPAPEAKT